MVNYPKASGAEQQPPTRGETDSAKTSLLVTLSVALVAIPVCVFVIRDQTDSMGMILMIASMFSPAALAIGVFFPLSVLLVPRKGERTVPIGLFWAIAVIHMISLAILGLAFTDFDISQDEVFVSPILRGTTDPRQIAAIISNSAATIFVVTYIAFIVLAIAARITRRRPCPAI